MTSYGQFCPVAKATEIIGEKWTLLILRELLMGTSRFNDFQRAMSRISPTVLNKRLKQLEDKGVVVKKRLSGQKGFEYRLSAMGRSLWYAYKLTGEDVYRERALAIGRYIKHRLIPGPDGAYYWSYWLPLEPVTASIPKEEVNAEDVSHASLTMSLPILLAGENQVFSEADMRRLGKTVTEGFARLNNGVLFGTVNGNPGSNTDVVQIPGRWLRLTPFAREVYPRIADFYLNYQEKPGPLGLALLLRYKPEP